MTKPDPHIARFRVYYEDTDAGGIVYHANYLKFAERGRTDMLRETGWNHRQVMADFKLMLVVRRLEVDYRASAYLDDMLEVKSEVAALGNASVTLLQSILRDGLLLAEIKTVIVAVGQDGKPLRIPPQLRQILGDTGGEK